ncbi:FtsW/RodA/SpoVE family cell cycle protein [Synechococcus elongatus]|uniref:FtsW/RodA/SpoVE family cell cycle protein n=1 Tax=Synechococcus elongatus TaxID=32046 RepID=UPI000F7EB459|nr:FtsW/RodA/SpoVE family cell cycle protein [Synechococcus elongatus]
MSLALPQWLTLVPTATWNRPARLLHWLTFFWLVCGLLILLSASYDLALNESGNGFAYLIRQGVWLILGLLGFSWAIATPIQRFARWAPWGMGLCLVGLALTLVAGATINGASRWLVIGPLQIQPSELMKPCLILQGAVVFGSWFRLSWAQRGFWLAMFLLTLGIILKQPNLSTATLCGSLLWIIALAAGLPLAQLLFTVIGGGAIGVVSVFRNSYQMERILSFLNPWRDPLDKSYQLVQSLLAIGSGGTWGTGYGLSVQKLSYLPIQNTDFIFAVYAEEFGLVGSLLFLLFLCCFGTVGFWVALRSRRVLNQLVATGCTTLLVLQSLLNIGVASGALPTTGLPLPFISYGGNALLSSLFVAGLLIRVALEMDEEIANSPGPTTPLKTVRRRSPA